MIVAEKPSVAMSYAKVLGATNRQDGYWEGNGYLVSWCIGHLVELAPPNVYDEKYVKWSVADLPILPERWQYLVSASTKKQFGILKKLMNRPDVDSVTAATDAGREGELIFRLVYQQTGCKKPVFRLWLSSMEESAIREGFANLKPSTEYDALYNAALCRERADWIVGINASRLFSCLYGRPLAVGRVMTPVLAMTVVREAEIAAFTPEKFYTVALAFAGGGTASSRRFSQKADAEALLTSCRKEACAVVSGGLFSAGTRKIGCARTHDRGSTGRNHVRPQPGKNACISLSPEEFAQKLADREEIQSYRMKQFRQSGQDCYLLMQLKRDADPALRFASMRYLEKQNIAPAIDNYEILYRGNLPTGKRSVPQPELLEQLYQKFNCAQPMDYHGHSLSVSDVILLNQAGKISAHYVDSIGFRELSGFQDKQERSSVLSQLKAKCDMPECNPTKCRKERDDHAI